MRLEPTQVDRVVRTHRDESCLRDDVLDECDQRRRQYDARGGRTLEDNGEKREVEVVEVLVGDQHPIDPVRGEREGWRRDESALVGTHPWVDDELDAVDCEPETSLAEPGQPMSHRVRL